MMTLLLRAHGIEGHSSMEGYVGWIPALSLRHSLEQGATFGRPLMTMLLTRRPDPTSPRLARACAEGVRIEEIDVHSMHMHDGRWEANMAFTIRNVRVTNWTLIADERSFDEHVEELHLSFGAVSWAFGVFVDGNRVGEVTEQFSMLPHG